MNWPDESSSYLRLLFGPSLIILIAFWVFAKFDCLNGIVGRNPRYFYLIAFGEAYRVSSSFPMFTDEMTVLLNCILWILARCSTNLTVLPCVERFLWNIMFLFEAVVHALRFECFVSLTSWSMDDLTSISMEPRLGFLLLFKLGLLLIC
jgi:hypothetical protein